MASIGVALRDGDYTAEVMRRRARAMRVAMADEEVPVEYVSVPMEMVNQYDRAA